MKIKTEMTRRARIQGMQVGETIVFFPGDNPDLHSLQRSISAETSRPEVKDGQFSQRKALVVIEGEVPIAVSVLTRTA